MSNGQPDRPTSHIPKVYEKIEREPRHWEYRVLSFDPREEALPDQEALNELGGSGWLLVNILNATEGRAGKVYYYFVREGE